MPNSDNLPIEGVSRPVGGAELITDVAPYAQIVAGHKIFERTLEHRIIGVIKGNWRFHARFWIDLESVNGFPRAEWEKLETLPEGDCVIVFRGHKRIHHPRYLTQRNAPAVDQETRVEICHALTWSHAKRDIPLRLADGHDGWIVMLDGRLEKNAEGEPVFTLIRRTSSKNRIAERLAALKSVA